MSWHYYTTIIMMTSNIELVSAKTRHFAPLSELVFAAADSADSADSTHTVDSADSAPILHRINP